MASSRRDARPRWGRLVSIVAVPALVFAGSLGVGVASMPPPTTPPPTTVSWEMATELTTPLLSVRRSPTAHSERARQQRVHAAFVQDVAPLIAQVGERGCLVVSTDGVELSAHRDDVSLIPASNQKLFVAAAALEMLGPDFRFTTRLLGPRPVDGVIPGDVYVVGGGDPVLASPFISDPVRYPAFNTTSAVQLVNALTSSGVTRIDGDVIGDGERYDDEFRSPTWGDNITQADAGPIDALLLSDGLLPDGTRARVPSQSAASAMVQVFTEYGIDVSGGANNGPSPAGLDVLAEATSASLSEIVAELLHTSDNNTAEMLVKELGHQTSGEPGSWPTGLAALRETLSALDIPLTGTNFADGSGLSRNNTTTCSTLAATLMHGPPALLDLLPTAGRDGTLRSYFVATPGEGVVDAKTGTLTGVKALTGVFDAADSPVYFSIVLNGPQVNQPEVFEPLWYELAEVLSRYPAPVTIDISDFSPR